MHSCCAALLLSTSVGSANRSINMTVKQETVIFQPNTSQALPIGGIRGQRAIGAR